jgi:hypothetical protein
MSDMTRILLGIAFPVLPAAYLALCVWMCFRRVWWFTFVSYFIIFGTVGGWFFAFAESPSGIAATSFIFLISIALACVISSLALSGRKMRTRFESVAMACGFSCPVLLATYISYCVWYIPR